MWAPRRRAGGFLILALLATGSLIRATHAADREAIERALQKQRMPSGEPLVAAQKFIETRVATLPGFSTQAAWERYAARLRQTILNEIVFRGEAATWRNVKTAVEWLDTIPGGQGYHIRKLRYEAVPGFWIPALLYEPEKITAPVPGVLNLGGHEAEGKAVPYKQVRCINLAKRGLLALHPEWIGMGQLRASGYAHGRLNQLDLCGTSGLAVFYLAMWRGLEVLAQYPHIDEKRLAVTGLSGGGWQTAWLSALDDRVALANPVAGYNSLKTAIRVGDLGDSEQAPSDFAAIADGTHLTALRAPRPTLLTYNANDECCFKAEQTIPPLVDAARPLFALYGAKDRLRWHVNFQPGTHNYERENRERFYALIDDGFFPRSTANQINEIDCDQEIKSATDLEVPLPSNNLDFPAIAGCLADMLPREPAIPTEKDALTQWQVRRREIFRKLLRIPVFEPLEIDRSDENHDGLATSHFLLRLAEWSLPVTIFGAASKRERTAIVIADQGRAAASGQIASLLDDGWQVAAVDPLLFGQSQITGSDPQVYFALAVGSVGQRPLGIQAGQLVALAQHLSKTGPSPHLFAGGRRSSMAALVATAAAPTSIAAVRVDDALASLKQLISENRAVEEYPELFPFGLMAEFDVPHIAALIAPRPLSIHSSGQHAESALAPVEKLYQALNAGTKFQAD